MKTYTMVAFVISIFFIMFTNEVEMTAQLYNADVKVKVKISLHFFDHVGDVLWIVKAEVVKDSKTNYLICSPINCWNDLYDQCYKTFF